MKSPQLWAADVESGQELKGLMETCFLFLIMTLVSTAVTKLFMKLTFTGVFFLIEKTPMFFRNIVCCALLSVFILSSYLIIFMLYKF